MSAPEQHQRARAAFQPGRARRPAGGLREGFRPDWHVAVQRIVGEGGHAASWAELTDTDGTMTGVCFSGLSEDGRIQTITDFWPTPGELPAGRAYLVERY